MQKFTLITLFLATTFPSTYLSAQETLKLVTAELPPYYSQYLPDQGIYSAITKKVLNHAGYSVQISFVPKKRALHEVSMGNYDGILGVYDSKELQQSLVFTANIALSDYVIAVRQDSDFYSGNNLVGKSIVGLSGSKALELLKASGMRSYEVSHALQGLLMLNFGRVDAFVVERDVIDYQFEISGEALGLELQNVRYLDMNNRPRAIHNAFSRRKSNSNELTQEFNLAFRLLYPEKK